MLDSELPRQSGGVHFGLGRLQRDGLAALGVDEEEAGVRFNGVLAWAGSREVVRLRDCMSV